MRKDDRRHSRDREYRTSNKRYSSSHSHKNEGETYRQGRSRSREKSRADEGFKNANANDNNYGTNSKSLNAAQPTKSGEPRWGKEEDHHERIGDTSAAADEQLPKFKPDFGLSGALAKDEKTGNTVNGVVLKFTEPFEAAKPDKNWRFYVYRGEGLIETLHVHRRSCFLVGRDDRVADIPTLHPTCSLQHAVLQFRTVEKKEILDGERVVVSYIKPYIMDLQSTHGTFLNGTRIEDSRYYELLEGDVLKFGGSSREYVLLHDQSKNEV